jgi:predicted exporter
VKRINYVLYGNDPEYERLPNEIETVQFQDYETIDGKETLVKKTEDIQGFDIVTVFLAIFVLMAVQFRSLVVGMITSIPVFIAVLFNFAVMWALGITVNVGTSIVVSVGMGVGIDYSHKLYFRRPTLVPIITQASD